MASPRRTRWPNHRALVDAEFALNSDGGGGIPRRGAAARPGSAWQTAEKTFASFELTARNPGGHSSQPRADNAIYDLAAALGKLQAYRFPVMWNDTTLAYLQGELRGMRGRRTGQGHGRPRAEPERRGGRRGSDTSRPVEVGQIRTTCIPTLLTWRPRRERAPSVGDGDGKLPHISRRRGRGSADDADKGWPAQLLK